MFIDKPYCEREILKIINLSRNVTELRPKIEQFWEKMIKSSYDDNVHSLAWFRNKVSQNVLDADNGGTNWEGAVNAVCAKPNDINNILKQIEAGALFGFTTRDNTEVFIDTLMKSGDIATTSLVLCVSGGDIITTDVRSSGNLIGSSMEAALQSRPEMLKMLLGFYPNTFVKPELLDLYKKQAPNVVIKTYLQQNLSTYNEYLKSRGLKPVFSKEDAFAQALPDKQANESAANHEIVEKIRMRNRIGPTHTQGN